MEPIVTGLLWFAAFSCGLLAGLYFAFSAFIMTALGSMDRAAGAAAMNAINVAILRSLFMPLFLVSTLASLALAILGLLRWGGEGAAEMLAGGLLYIVGMFVVTMLFNVPLNNALQAREGDDELWSRYLRQWTAWNHVRTFASTGALGLFIAAIAAS